MTRKSSLTVLVGAAVLMAGPATVRAFCGFYVGGADTELYNNATLVVMMREGTRTVLSMQNNYEGPPQDFAMVVPVPVVLQEENVRTLPTDVFDRVDRLAAPRLVEYWEQDPCFVAPAERGRSGGALPMAPAAEPSAVGDAAPLVTIEAQFEVGEYDVVVLSARDSSALETWLRQNEYRIPEGAEPILRPYVEAGTKFFVAKVNVERVRFENGQAMLSPLRFHYDSDNFDLPVRLGLLNSKGTQDLIVHILAPDQRYEAANYENVTVPTNLDVADSVRQQFGAFYAALFDRTLEQNPGAVVTEYAWQATNCDPCPGPVLSASDLTTLGADVLPSTATQRTGSAQLTTVTADPALDRRVVDAVLLGAAPGLQSCLQQAIERGLSAGTSGTVQIQVGGDGLVSNVRVAGGTPDPALRTCVESQLRALRFPPPRTGAPADLSASLALQVQPQNPWEVQQRLNAFVLTRLHARYTTEALGEDLVFRPADPIVGGREIRAGGGDLEKGAQPAGANNFQGRYAIRHPWEGPIECAEPVRGRWGGPPPGIQRPAGPQAAQDLAFAPRGQVRLTDLLKQDVPELQLSGFAAANPGVGTGHSPQTTGATRGSSDCDCRTTGAAGAPVGALGVLATLGAVLWRRRRR